MKPGKASLFRQFPTVPGVEVAPVVYRTEQGGLPHRTTDQGLVIGAEASRELRTFVQAYAGMMRASEPQFWRLDVYPYEDRLVVLEVNAAFVDGWGVALNLARAAGIEVAAGQIGFPRSFGVSGAMGWHCLPELELLVSELSARGLGQHKIDSFDGQTGSGPTYVYGRQPDPQKWPGRVWPIDGRSRDNKLHLARFSRAWRSRLVTTPECFTAADTAWQDVPAAVYLKVADKDDREVLQRVKFSVRAGKPSGKAPFLRQCYNASRLIGQLAVPPRSVTLNGWEQFAQLVVLTNGQVITGYVQYSGQSNIINDNSVHGPAQFLG